MDKDSAGKVVFYSKTPFGEFEKLVEDAPQYDNYSAFNNNAPATLKDPLIEFAEKIQRSEEETFELCKRIEFGPYHKEWDRINLNELRQIVPKPDSAITELERLARKNQAGAGKNALKRVDIEAALSKVGIVRAPNVAESEIISQFTRENLRDTSRIKNSFPFSAPL